MISTFHMIIDYLITTLTGAKGFGFTLIAIKVNTGPLPNGRYRVVVRHMITDVAKFGAASDAGIKKDDLINCVNGERTAQLTHQQVVDLIRGSDKQVLELLVEYRLEQFAEKYSLFKGIQCRNFYFES